MEDRARGILDAVFAKQTDADVDMEARKEETRRKFAKQFVDWVLKEIEEWCASGGKIGFGKKLCLEGNFVPRTTSATRCAKVQGVELSGSCAQQVHESAGVRSIHE